MNQQIRISQFVTTYGPGALIEGTEGPRVIPLSDIGIFDYSQVKRTPQKYEISDQRMSVGLLEGGSIYRLPSNAELEAPENQYVYKTKPFPIWKLCLNRQGHRGEFYFLYRGSSCPVCGIMRGKGREAIRFIVACTAGHMDEVDWYVLAHGFNSTCRHKEWFRWYGGGGVLSQTQVECPECKKREFNLGWAWGHNWKCSGRFPERELVNQPPYPHDCDRFAKMIQRQASNLRIPDPVTLFSIPPRHTRLHRLIQTGPIYDNIVGSRPSSMDQFAQMLRNLALRGRIDAIVADEILQSSWQDVQKAMQDVLTPIPNKLSDLLLEEFHELVYGSVHGIPPVHSKPKSPPIIEMNPHLVQKCKGIKGTVFRVAPVLRLRTVVVQRGYRREVETGVLSELVPVWFTDHQNSNQRWYPGVEFPGEGIFVMLDQNDGWDYQITGETANNWITAFRNPPTYPGIVFRDQLRRDELHPSFVWWHTISHLLIRAVAAEAGYSSAAIRERVYLEQKENRTRGGVLLYATQPGSEGTLGGLIALAPHFQDMIDNASEQLDTCSGDPLCLEHRFQAGFYNGAACYGCLLLSETSCEHRNMWLDRNVVLENLP